MASPQTLQEQALDQACQTVLFVALELSDKKWKLALSDGNKKRIVTITAGDLVTLGEAVAKAKTRFGMPGSVPIVSCYEAGRDGFWLHRYLLHCGVANVVVPAKVLITSVVVFIVIPLAAGWITRTTLLKSRKRPSRSIRPGFSLPGLP